MYLTFRTCLLPVLKGDVLKGGEEVIAHKSAKENYKGKGVLGLYLCDDHYRVVVLDMKLIYSFWMKESEK